MKHVNALGKELNPKAYQKVFEALKIAEMALKYDMMNRIQQETEKKANQAILLAIKDALELAEGKQK